MVQEMKAGVTIPAIPTIWEVTMTSATTTPSRGARGRSAEGQGYGLVVFAVALLAVIGCFNLIYGIAAIANAHVFTANAHYVFGSLRTWGWITLIIGGLQVLAAVGVMGGQPDGPLVRRGRARAQRHRPDVLHPRLPVLVANHHRDGCRRAVGPVRLRQPREPGRLARHAPSAGRTEACRSRSRREARHE